MKKYNISKLQNMIINLIEEGKEKTWKEIDRERDPLRRCELRRLYARAIQKGKIQ